jgi:hypothetical protein
LYQLPNQNIAVIPQVIKRSSSFFFRETGGVYNLQQKIILKKVHNSTKQARELPSHITGSWKFWLCNHKHNQNFQFL